MFRFVVIGRIVDHHCLNFLFRTIIQYKFDIRRCDDYFLAHIAITRIF